MPPLSSLSTHEEIVAQLTATSQAIWGEKRTEELAEPIAAAAVHIRLLFSEPLDLTDHAPDYIGTNGVAGHD